MNLDQQMIYLNKTYKILDLEQEWIVHPAAFGLLPLLSASLQSPFSCNFHVEDYRLILDQFTLPKEEPCDRDGTKTAGTTKQYELQGFMVPYNGAVLIGADPVREYFTKPGKPACFSYQNVFELVFKDGILITTVDQSKAMLRIRKNLEIGLRSLNNSRDLRCIKRFINSSFIGDYKKFILSRSRLRYLKEMKNDYKDTNYIIE
jgi:hypothetical protein